MVEPLFAGALEEAGPDVFEQFGGQYAVIEASRINPVDRVQVRAWPGKPIRFIDDHPGSFAVQAKTLFCRRRNFDGFVAPGRRRVRNRDDDDNDFA